MAVGAKPIEIQGRQRNVAEEELRSRTPEIHGAVAYHSQRVPGLREMRLEHFGEKSAIRSNPTGA